MRPSTSHKSIKVEGEVKVDLTTDQMIINPEIDHTAEIVIGIPPIEAEETMTEFIDQIIEVDQDTIVEKMIGEIITGKMIGKTTSDMMIGETITDRIIGGITIGAITDEIMDVIIIETKDIEIEVQVQ